MPFALGLAALAGGSSRLAPWAWGINGCASVLSAGLASLLAMHYGFDIVILAAMACYGLAAASFPRPATGQDSGLMLRNPAGTRIHE